MMPVQIKPLRLMKTSAPPSRRLARAPRHTCRTDLYFQGTAPLSPPGHRCHTCTVRTHITNPSGTSGFALECRTDRNRYHIPGDICSIPTSGPQPATLHRICPLHSYIRYFHRTHYSSHLCILFYTRKPRARYCHVGGFFRRHTSHMAKQHPSFRARNPHDSACIHMCRRRRQLTRTVIH